MSKSTGYRSATTDHTERYLTKQHNLDRFALTAVTFALIYFLGLWYVVVHAVDNVIVSVLRELLTLPSIALIGMGTVFLCVKLIKGHGNRITVAILLVSSLGISSYVFYCDRRTLE